MCSDNGIAILPVASKFAKDKRRKKCDMILPATSKFKVKQREGYDAILPAASKFAREKKKKKI